MNKQPVAGHLRIADVMIRTGLSRAHIYRMIRLGKFPASRKIFRVNKLEVFWDAAAVDSWVAAATPQHSAMSAEYKDGWRNGYSYLAEEHNRELEHLYEQQEQMGLVSDRLFLLANALQNPGKDTKMRNDAWWSLYALRIAAEIKALAKTMPGGLAALIEFEGDLPPDPA